MVCPAASILHIWDLIPMRFFTTGGVSLAAVNIYFYIAQWEAEQLN